MTRAAIENSKSQIMRVLLVEDNPEDIGLIGALLAEADDGARFALECADRLDSALKRLAQGGIDVVLLALALPDSQGLATLIRMHAHIPEVPIVALGGVDDEALVAHAVQKGAQDYLVRDQVDSNLLVRSMRYAIERQRMLVELEQRTQESLGLLYSLDNIIRKTPDGIVIVDTAGVVQLVNPAAESLLNRKSEELIGKMFGFPIVGAEKTELDIIRKGREAAIVEVHVVEMEWKGEIVYLASLRDISEHKQTAEKLRELEEISRLQGKKKLSR